jgi:hypothetical protein
MKYPATPLLATKEEAFAQSMQAARGDKGAMATGSVSSNCRLLLK